MEWVLAALAIVIIGLAALAAAGQLGSLPPAGDDVYRPELPERALTGADLRALRFGVAIRGYDVAQVDALLNRLADQLDGGVAGAEPEGIMSPATITEALGARTSVAAGPADQSHASVAPTTTTAVDAGDPEGRAQIAQTASAVGADAE